MSLNQILSMKLGQRRIAAGRPSRAQAAAAALLLVVALWGASFVVVRAAVAAYPVVGFLFLRMLLGGLALMVVAYLRPGSRPRWAQVPRRSLLGVGAALTVGYVTQTMGLALGAPAGVAATLTSLVVVLAPAWEWGMTGRAPDRRVVASSVLAVGGTILICHAAPASGAGTGDAILGIALEIVSAAAFALQVVLVGRLGESLSATALGGAQLLLVAVMLLPALPLAGGLPAPSAGVAAAVLFSALGASAFGFAVQAAAQKHLTTEAAAVIMATEPAFALVAAALSGEQQLGMAAAGGLGLLLLGVAAQGNAPGALLGAVAERVGTRLRWRQA
jgi:drug/metabolite transporter (DMT)-like permease